MINLRDHVVVIGDEEFIPLKIAQAAVAESYSDTKLDDAMDMIKRAVEDMNNTVKDVLKND